MKYFLLARRVRVSPYKISYSKHHNNLCSSILCLIDVDVDDDILAFKPSEIVNKYGMLSCDNDKIYLIPLCTISED